MLDVDLQMLAEDDDDFFERPFDEIVEKVVSKMRKNLTDELRHLLRRDS